MRPLSSLTLARDSPACLSQPVITDCLPTHYSPNHWSPYVTYILTKSSKRETFTQLHNGQRHPFKPTFIPTHDLFHLELLFFVSNIKANTQAVCARGESARPPVCVTFQRMAERDTDWRCVFPAILPSLFVWQTTRERYWLPHVLLHMCKVQRSAWACVWAVGPPGIKTPSSWLTHSLSLHPLF